MVRIAFCFAAATLAAGCATMQASGPTAVAKLESTKGNSAAGTVTFTQVGDEVRVSANVTGLKPGASHGFHVHEKGDCSSGDGMSTGGHFNPLGKGHAQHGSGEHHAGDLPSLTADSYGNASLSFTTKAIAVGSGATDVIGKGLIVHRDPDDYKTQPTGNAGPRIACAVIQKA
jgi:superoxide dismutase, Cu-Zn family